MRTTETVAAGQPAPPGFADVALATIDGARQAGEVIDALTDGTAEPEALADLLDRLCCHARRGACSVLAKALTSGVRRA